MQDVNQKSERAVSATGPVYDALLASDASIPPTSPIQEVQIIHCEHAETGIKVDVVRRYRSKSTSRKDATIEFAYSSTTGQDVVANNGQFWLITQCGEQPLSVLQHESLE
ncbi:MAG: hypothetical protein R3C53_13280 [Pirellulaceae bacterium]